MTFNIRHFARFGSLATANKTRLTNAPPLRNMIKTCDVGGQNQIQHRHFFLHWLNSVFNKYSRDRVEEVGPDRACAEWLMRNGAFVQWMGAKEFVKDYNDLPIKGNEKGQYFIKSVDATDSSIMAMGFPHFKGCNHIEKITFRKCHHLHDDAMPLLSVLKSSLRTLEIIECWNLTSDGILSLTALSNLRTLKLERLIEVKDSGTVEQKLKESLPNCEILFVKSSVTVTK